VFSGRGIGGGFGDKGVKNKRGIAAGAEPGKGAEIELGTGQGIAAELQFFPLFRLKNNHNPLLINYI